MTIAEKYSDRPFAMMNLHSLWCAKQSQRFACYQLGRHCEDDIKHTWEECPNRNMCFAAFIHSDAKKIECKY